MAASSASSSIPQATGMGSLAAQRKDSIARSMSRYRRRGARPASGGFSTRTGGQQSEAVPLVGPSMATVPSPETPRSFVPNEEEARAVYAEAGGGGGASHRLQEATAHGRQAVAVRDAGPIQNHSNQHQNGVMHSRGQPKEHISRSTSTRSRRSSDSRQRPSFTAEDTRRDLSASQADDMLTSCFPTKRDKDVTEKPSQAPADPSTAAMGPGIDAPVSAVNAGERTVLVRFGPAETMISVTPSTTAVDVIYSAAFSFSQKVHPQNALMKECFEPLGLERPIRNYERIRDILNSWDTDSLNSLVLVPAGVDEDSDDLQVRAAPRTRPAEMTVHIYHSQKPGKWDKRFITIRSDGQVIAAKKEGSKDAVNICHLSDFDIYQPTARQLSKRLKPPKKYCYAIKSQQKSSMFLSKENFIHFLCTNDKRLAVAFYKGVQQWRSWYLVNVMGEGRTSPKSSEKIAGIALVNGRSNSLREHQRPQSAGSAGSDGVARPLLDLRDAHIVEARSRSTLAQLKEMSVPQAPMSTKAMHDRAMSLRQHGPPPVSFPSRFVERTNSLTSRPRGSSLASPLNSESEEDSAFAPNGLLGRTYSQRQKAMQDREAGTIGAVKRRSQDLTDGREHSTTATKAGGAAAAAAAQNGHATTTAATTVGASSNADGVGTSGLGRSLSTRSRADSVNGSGLKRGPSVRQQKQMPKPLVDLSPAYREPPQHARKGRGVVIDHVPAGGLVEIANNPAEVAIQVPAATTWRRPRTADDSVQRRATVSRRDRAGSQPNGTGHHHEIQQSQNHRSAPHHNNHHPHHHSRQSDPTQPQLDSGDDSRDPFTGGGLLAQTPLSRGGSRHGRGVMDGSHANGPMLDLRERSQFSPGSLLAKVEKDRPAPGPTIAREKAREIVVGVGEAVN
ncbi:hypothetical protein L228DRAFT_270285 [Xylona heveae TC161]|uniref:PH domain-containing protein n=1 Tax=Xylona heveae (strain CBS 132557 / TC161) TaxID=1328760 RepID=A0A165AB09_XYLHT|nr:hypothetical protein L228DRAFT_270285 [Xylona heveae TC161]KZF20192.1 hypothetical protein L228DRAFT_270285 [Xylona heveae TC161]